MKIFKKVSLIIIAIIIVICAIVLLITVTDKKMGDDIKSMNVSGKIVLRSGDCAPTIDKSNKCKIDGTSRKLYIYSLLYEKDFPKPEPGTDEVNYFASSIEPILTAVSDNNGEYSVKLPNGEYTIFVEDNGKQYCNHWGNNGELCKIELKDGVATPFEFVINHATD